MFQFKNPRPIPNPLTFETVPKVRIQRMVEKELKEYNTFLSELQNKERELFVHIARLKSELAPIQEKYNMLEFLKSIEPTYHLNAYEFSDQSYESFRSINILNDEIDLRQKDINGTQVRIQMTNEKIKICARILECL